MSIFKKAFARGVNDELIRLGRIRYLSKEAADAVADAVGETMPVEPATAEAVPAEVAADVATKLVDAANELVEAASGGSAPSPETAAGMEEAAKQSAAADIDTRAYEQAVSLMKAAAAKHAMGSTIEGGDKGNALSDSPNAEAQMENKNRPQGTYNLGVGKTQLPTGAGSVGTETVPAPNTSNSPHESPNGSNSVIDHSKQSSVLEQIIQKVAMGSTIEGGDKGNTLQQAASVTGEAKIEADRRPEGYANVGVGNTNFPMGAGVVGSEQAHPDQPGNSPGGTPGMGNSVTAWSASNENGAKAASDDAFISLFKQTAEKVATDLPTRLSEQQKVACVRRMMGMTSAERSEYIGMLHKEAGATDEQAIAAAKKHAEAQKQASANTDLLQRIRRVTQQALA